MSMLLGSVLPDKFWELHFQLVILLSCSCEAAKVPPLNIPGLVAVEAIEEGEERVELLGLH